MLRLPLPVPIYGHPFKRAVVKWCGVACGMVGMVCTYAYALKESTAGAATIDGIQKPN